MYLRASLCLILSSLSACAFNDDGRLVPCVEGNCDLDTDPPSPPAPVHPISFAFDRGTYQGTDRIAVGGVMHLEVDSRASQVPSVTSTGDAFTIAVTSTEKHRTAVDVIGQHEGEGTIAATIPTFDQPAELQIRVAELASIAVGIDFESPRPQLTVLPDIREVALHLIATDGDPVLDHSLAIDPSSDPGFALASWDVVGLPATPGDRVLVLSRRAGDLHQIPIRVVDRVDEIVADHIDVGHTFGDLCVHALERGERVETHGWSFGGNKVVLANSFRNGCVSFYDAEPGALITVELAGTTTDFVIMPATP